MRSALPLRWLVVVAAFGGCGFNTVRTQDIGDGEIPGTARRAHGTPAGAAPGRVAPAGADGSFAVKGLVPGSWLLHVVEDDQGDGVPERAAWVTATLAFEPVAKSVNEGCTGTPPSAVTTQLLGDVRLDDTLHGTGTVTGAA